MPWWGILIIIAAVAVAAFLIISFIGKRAQRKQDAQREQMEAAKQSVNMLVIDKKKMRMKDAGFPQVVLDNTPKLLRRAKVPVVKAKIGPRMATLMADKDVFDLIPVKKEVKAEVSGLYIVNVKGIRGGLVSDKAAKKAAKKESKFETLLRKGRGEI